MACAMSAVLTSMTEGGREGLTKGGETVPGTPGTPVEAPPIVNLLCFGVCSINKYIHRSRVNK